jgi:hypothetical protein
MLVILGHVKYHKTQDNLAKSQPLNAHFNRNRVQMWTFLVCSLFLWGLFSYLMLSYRFYLTTLSPPPILRCRITAPSVRTKLERMRKEAGFYCIDTPPSRTFRFHIQRTDCRENVRGDIIRRVGNLTEERTPVFNEISDMEILFPVVCWKYCGV